MYKSTLFLALAATALSTPPEVIQIRQIVARQDLSSIDLATIGTLVPSACIPPSTLLQGSPTLPADVESAIVTWSPTNACETPKFTGSVSSAYSSYSSAVESWAKAHSKDYESFYSAYKTACPYATMASMSSVPTNTADLLSLAGCTSTPTGGAANQNNNSSSKTGGSTGAAPRQTALAAAVGVVAGVAALVL